jgi:geranyl-CoA carboxylase alpha subunit
VKTLNKLLIANRGEIVVRVVRSARRLGIATVAVCSDADRDAPHSRACDEWVPIGGLTPAESYLVAQRHIDAALAKNAQAIHPGYGFLSENATFAALVEQAGLIFVGPPAAAIEAMGDKARARRRMSAAGVPVVPGYDGDEQSEERLVAEAKRIGLPVMVKAAAGGGGRGMRKVTSLETLAQALRSAASEAQKAFGDGRLILERAIEEPRHVEIQVIADAHGHVIHLGERDCSVQRRHQKIVEEAPSPAVDPVLRERMGQAAVAVAREIGYQGAGTVEFLLDRGGHFYFMEMNTRLQVEHPVTELVTGLDLVELQLRIARGEPLPLRQDDVRLKGHAVEVRLCAEDPADDFLPRSGTVLDWSADELVRCDHAIARGMPVSPYYDSMLAKIIAHGATRDEALDRLARGLDRTTLLGVATNRALLANLLRHPAFVDGSQVSTAFIEQHYPDGASRIEVPDDATWRLAAWLSVAAAPESQQVAPGWRNWMSGSKVPATWRLQWLAPASLGESSQQARRGRLYLDPEQTVVEAGETRGTVCGLPVPPATRGEAQLDGTPLSYRYVIDGESLWLQTARGDYVFRNLRHQAMRSGSASDAARGDVRATMNGRVIAVGVKEGDAVQSGQLLVVIEAMKMEHQVFARGAGRAAAVSVSVGDQVAPGTLLVRLDEQTVGSG